jgi:DNA-directed RNA polymerase beta subunit
MHLGECPYDQGAYFVINGGEKVVIAHERMANNQVYVYPRKQPAKYAYVGEIRSVLDMSQKPTATLYVGMLTHSGRIEVTIPYIRAPIPLVVVFRALGEIADRDIIEKIVYNFEDDDMLQLLRPSLHEAFVVQSADVALDFIGKRGSTSACSAPTAFATRARFCRRSFCRTSASAPTSRRRRPTFSATWCIACSPPTCVASWSTTATTTAASVSTSPAR